VSPSSAIPSSAIPSSAIPVPARRLSLGEQFVLSLHWFGLNFHWGALLAVVIPAAVLRFVPEEFKGRALALVFAGGALVAMIVMPLAGALSDRSAARLGRRRPFIIVGALLNALALLTLAAAPSLLLFVAAYWFVQFANNLGGSAYSGLIPDFVPEEQRGSAAGFMGVMIMLGTVGGSVAAGELMRRRPLLVYLLIITVLLLTMLITAVRVREVPLGERAPFRWGEFLRGFWISPRRYPNFAWLFASRFLALLGFYSILSFLLYFLRDYMHIADFERATGRLSAAVILGALTSAYATGRLSDRVGRRPLVSLATVVMAGTILIFLIAPSFAAMLALGFLFGIGYGAFVSVEWALAIDVLPSPAEAAKYLGVWGISATLPQVVAPLIGGPVLDFGNLLRPSLGFVVLLAAASAYLLVSAGLIWKIRGIR
jgi:MFS family permease